MSNRYYFLIRLNKFIQCYRIPALRPIQFIPNHTEKNSF